VRNHLYLAAAIALLAGWVPLVVMCVRAHTIDGLVALQLAGTLTTLVLVCLAVGLHQSGFAPVALISALCAIVGGLVYARYLDRYP
jgi:multisubunit Na+/H+ antiporter MnhF subunit